MQFLQVLLQVNQSPPCWSPPSCSVNIIINIIVTTSVSSVAEQLMILTVICPPGSAWKLGKQYWASSSSSLSFLFVSLLPYHHCCHCQFILLLPVKMLHLSVDFKPEIGNSILDRSLRSYFALELTSGSGFGLEVEHYFTQHYIYIWLCLNDFSLKFNFRVKLRITTKPFLLLSPIPITSTMGDDIQKEAFQWYVGGPILHQSAFCALSVTGPQSRFWFWC